MNLSLARIEVRPSFCNNCSDGLRREIDKIPEILNIELYPKDSLITFHFTSANRLSNVLNLLTHLGYREKEELKHSGQEILCQC